MTDTNKLKELAERASVGDWSYSPCIEGQPFFGQVWDAAGDSLCVMDHMTGQANADGDYIAAANPKAILNLIAEVERLRIGLKGDYDLDAWMEWTREKDRLKAENEELRGALQAVVDDPTWRSNDNTLWPKIIKAMDKGAKQ